ncbi:MAG: penicillin-insensitive murein endopeptidase, partial [Persicimonas sp.]
REYDSSVSLGTTGSGELVNAASLPVESDHHSIIERHRPRGTHYGSEALVRVIEEAAAAVAEDHPKAVLRVGNLSYEQGGDIPWSRSHNSGRDADLAFYVERREDGEAVPAPSLLSFDASGRSRERPDLVFDVERNWSLVAALLEHEEVDIQWLFISNPLKAKLLRHAEQEGEPDELIERASKLLHQPTGAAPHDDHFHLRITCPREDRLEGCLDYGPRWEWVDWHRDDLFARSLEIARALDSERVDLRKRALDYLERIEAPAAPEIALSAALGEEDPEVRRRALEVAESVPLWSKGAVAMASDFVEAERFSLDEKKYAYGVLRKSADAYAADALAARLAEDELRLEERVLAAESMVHLMEPDLVPVVLDELARQPGEVRKPLARVLYRITNRSDDIDWEDDGESKRMAALEEWRGWYEDHRDYDRRDWVEEGFVGQGLQSDALFEEEAVGELIDLLDDGPDHVAYNANRVLRTITDRWAPLEAWSYSRLHRHWSSWWRLQSSEDEVALLTGSDPN